MNGTLTVDSTSTLTGNATFGGSLLSATTTNAQSVFATTTGAVTIGNGDVNISATGKTTTVDGALTVTEALTLTGGLSSALSVADGGTGQTSYTNGQLLIGNTTNNTLTKATLTDGANITITEGAGSITISAAAGTITNPYSSTTAKGNEDFNAADGDCYLVSINDQNGTYTCTLPAPTTGKKIKIILSLSLIHI